MQVGPRTGPATLAPFPRTPGVHLTTSPSPATLAASARTPGVHLTTGPRRPAPSETGRRGRAQPYSTTWNWAIIAPSSCSRTWQWIMNTPRLSVNFRRITTVWPALMFQVSFISS